VTYVVPEVQPAAEHFHFLDPLLHVANDARFGQTHAGNHLRTDAFSNFISIFSPISIEFLLLAGGEIDLFNHGRVVGH